MTKIVKMLSFLAAFLDKRFPEKMTTAEVLERWSKAESRILTLENQHNIMLGKIQSLQMMIGVKSSIDKIGI